nr:hypothetical protein CFP56_75001 [Quercus suber]
MPSSLPSKSMITVSDAESSGNNSTRLLRSQTRLDSRTVKKHKATPDMQLFQYHCDGFPDEKRFKGKKGVDLLLQL